MEKKVSWAHKIFEKKRQQLQSLEFPFHFTKLVAIYSNEVKKTASANSQLNRYAA